MPVCEHAIEEQKVIQKVKNSLLKVFYFAGGVEVTEGVFTLGVECLIKGYVFFFFGEVIYVTVHHDMLPQSLLRKRRA